MVAGRTYRGRRGGSWRAVVGVLALYCVLLQGFLANAAPLPPDLGAGIICAVHEDGSEPGKATTHAHQCCVAAQIQTLAPPPVLSSEGLLVRHPVLVVALRPEADIPRTGPPPSSHSPRGPPAV